MLILTGKILEITGWYKSRHLVFIFACLSLPRINDCSSQAADAQQWKTKKTTDVQEAKTGLMMPVKSPVSFTLHPLAECINLSTVGDVLLPEWCSNTACTGKQPHTQNLLQFFFYVWILWRTKHNNNRPYTNWYAAFSTKRGTHCILYKHQYNTTLTAVWIAVF